MKCTNPKMKKWVSLYQFNLLPEEDKIKVEAHLMECEACLKEVYRFSPVLEILEEMPEKFLDAVQPKETVWKRIIGFMQEQVDRLKKINLLFSSPVISWRPYPVPKILVPVAIAVLLTIIFWPHHPGEYSDLAVLEKAPYLAIRFKGTVEITPAQQLYNEGMAFYEQNNFAAAGKKLLAYLEQEPDNAYGHFYLGVSCLLTNEMDCGIEHLKKASRLCREQNLPILLARCHWYLGNAYLSLNDVGNALSDLRVVVQLEDEFETEAKELIVKIEARKKNLAQD